jgi:hypothetical protein
MSRTWVGLVACALAFLPPNGTSAGDRSPLEVLFIGNSYTDVNDLPSLAAGLAEAAGGRKIEMGQHVVGGYTIEQHVNDKKAFEKIREKKWDVVVLQDHSLPVYAGDTSPKRKRGTTLCLPRLRFGLVSPMNNSGSSNYRT